MVGGLQGNSHYSIDSQIVALCRTSLKKNSTQCVDGEWKEQLGHCARGCASVAEFDRQHSIGYSNQDKDGKYPDGTKATLSCTHGHPFGRTESLCNDGKWTQKLDHCGSSCSQRAMEEFGYSDMHVDGKRTDGNVTHRTDVEFLCGERICSTALAPRLGYTAVNIRGKSVAGYPVEGTLVGLLCRNCVAKHF
ncbi:unnamed protein product [Heligmosomoides polygyrus]|uniref:Sushi domain-containing protein n=1 Tax=Heligmosomoides polygyrus TaxID=6339 RepID=A0A183G6J9_HELPZ|nr:unnamed protein product [Heligmosomoides polygyrus]